MTVSAITNNALTPAPLAPASGSVGDLFSVPQPSDTTTGTSQTTGTVTSSQAQRELQALLLQLQGGATLNSTAAAGTSPSSTSTTASTDSNDPTDPNDPTNQTSETSVSAWLAQALQAYVPVAGVAGGPAGVGLALGASVIA